MPKPSVLDQLAFLAIVTMPMLPKIGISDSIFVNISDIIMVCYCTAYLADRTRWAISYYQTSLLCLFVAILIFTLPQDSAEYLGTLKVIKKIIYIPVVCVGFNVYRGPSDYTRLLYLGLSGILVCQLFYIIFIPEAQSINQAAWVTELISSGLSNRYINLSNFEIGLIMTGAHGVYAIFISMMAALALQSKRQGGISAVALVVINIILIYLVLQTPSRESLVFLFIAAMVLYRNYMFHSVGGIIVLLSICLIATLLVTTASRDIADLVDDISLFLPLGEKLKVSFEAIEYGDMLDGSGAARVNIVLCILGAIANNPYRAIIGYGHETPYYFSDIIRTGNELMLNVFATVPENLLFMSIAYGGLLGMAFYFTSFVGLHKDISEHRDSYTRDTLLSFLWAFLITSAAFSATMVTDYVFSWLLLMLGYHLRQDRVATALPA